MSASGDETHPHGIFADSEDDRYCCGRRFGRKRGSIAPECGDYRHATSDEVGHERWQAIVLALQPMIHRRVLALDVAGFVESFTERTDLAHRGVRRPAADEADDRYRRLLRARYKRKLLAAARRFSAMLPSGSKPIANVNVILRSVCGISVGATGDKGLAARGGLQTTD